MTAFQNERGWNSCFRSYKGNLHSHTIHSDGHLRPEEACDLYQKHGYSFLCFSEHDLYTDLSYLNTDTFIILPGLEASAVLLDSDGNRIKTHHMNGILGTDQMIQKASMHFRNRDALPVSLSSPAWDGGKEAQKLCDTLRQHGCMVTYNHPAWSRVSPEEFIHTEGISMIEIYNYDTVNESGTGSDTFCWDMMLREGRQVYAFASDDNHNGAFEDSCGGWVCVFAEELSRSAIAASLMAGQYYSSSGPQIYDWGIENDICSISCSPCERINFILGGPVGFGKTVLSYNKCITQAEIKLNEKTQHVRIECADHNGKKAWTNAIFPKKNED